jgi:hypothetical protein
MKKIRTNTGKCWNKFKAARRFGMVAGERATCQRRPARRINGIWL